MLKPQTCTAKATSLQRDPELKEYSVNWRSQNKGTFGGVPHNKTIVFLASPAIYGNYQIRRPNISIADSGTVITIWAGRRVHGGGGGSLFRGLGFKILTLSGNSVHHIRPPSSLNPSPALEYQRHG